MSEILINRAIDLVFLLLSIILGYIVGRFQERLRSSRATDENRYFNLYWKFEHLYLSKTEGAFLFSDLDLDLKKEFLDTLIDGYCYADSKLKRKITELRWQWISNDIDDLNKTFVEISTIIFDDSNRLSKKLYNLKYKL